MPVYTLPDFNLVAGVWTSSTPAFGPPDFTTPCQKYWYSRIVYVQIGDAVEIRVPVDNSKTYTGGYILEVPLGSGHYLEVVYVARVHEGFSNEYWGVYGVCCDANGNPTQPKIPTNA